MSRYNFTFSPAYVARRVSSQQIAVAAPAPMPAWTLLSAVMLASMIGGIVWFG